MSFTDDDKKISSNILCRKNIFYGIFILLLCTIIYCKTNKSENMSNENRSNENNSNENIADKIQQLIEEDKKPIKEKLINSCKSGMLNGFISGLLSGNFSDCIIGSASYGIVNPIIVYLEHMNSNKK